MTTPNNPLHYRGINQVLIPFVTRPRRPTVADYRQPETGKNYIYGSVWQVGINPTTGNYGELWMLQKIVSNQGIWALISNGSIPGGPILTLSDTANTLVSPTISGNIQLVGTADEINIVADPANNKFTFSLAGGSEAVDSFVTNIGGPVVPDVDGNVFVNASVTTFTDGSVTNTLKTEVQGTNNQLIYGRGPNVSASTIPIGIQGAILAQNGTGSAPVFSRTVDGDANMTFQAFTSGIGHFLVSQSTFTPAGSNAGVVASVAGGSGIAAVGATVSATRFFADVIDQSDSYSYKLLTGANSNITSGTLVRRVSTAGIFNYPLQPAFLAYLSSNASNVTGDGTTYNVVFDTEIFDQGGYFAANTFTAPATGKYRFDVSVGLFSLTAAFTSCLVSLVAGGQVYEIFRGNPGAIRDAGNQITITGSKLISLTAAQTAIVEITVSGDTKTVGVAGLLNYTTFAGNLVV